VNDIVELEALPAVSMRDKVNAIEAEMRRMPQLDMPVKHHFANKGTPHGTYARELFIPKGTVLTGKIHKFEQINIMSKGDISVLTEDGRLLEAPTDGIAKCRLSEAKAPQGAKA